MQYAWYDFVGTISTAVIIVTYILLQTGRIKSSSLIYSLLNAAGAAMILVSLIFSFNFSAFIVEFFWLLISLFGIVKFFLQKSDAQ
jgi:hypothetical protein